ARLYLMAQGVFCSGHRCTRGGYSSLVWMGIRTSNMDNRRHRRNGSAPQQARRPGNVTDIRYMFIRKTGSDRGQELINQDSWWWLKWNSSRILNEAMEAHSSNPEVTLMWTGWRAMLFNWYPNMLAIGPAGSWPAAAVPVQERQRRTNARSVKKSRRGLWRLS